MTTDKPKTRSLTTTDAIVMLALMPAFLLMSSSALAAVIVDNGATLDIDSNDASIDYVVRNNSVLNMTQATTQSVQVQSGSTLNINGATIVGNPGNSGLTINSSQATIARAIVSSDTYALMVNRPPASNQGSTVTAANSEFTGGNAGAAVTAFSTLELIDSVLTGTNAGSSGLIISGGAVRATADTRISGDASGVLMDDDPLGANPSLVLDNSSAEGLRGPAILVDQGVDASIQVLNGSRLIAADGNLLKVQGASTANMLVGSSILEGNVEVDGNSIANLTLDGAQWTGVFNIGSGSTGNLDLRNQSRFIGRLDGVSNLSINQSEWTMTGNDTVDALNMADGIVRFGTASAPGTYYQLNLGSLNGNGTFVMKVNFATGERDLLNINGAANGQFGLAVSASGKDTVSPQQLTLVHMDSGSATFSLVGGRVDDGAWSYSLASSTNATGGTDWYLDPNSRTISPGAQSVVALFKTAPTIVYGELTVLEKRMDELQTDANLQGFWIRPFSNKYNVDNVSGVGYQQRQQGLSLGIDNRLGDSPWRVGVMAGYSHADMDLNGGTSATVDSVFAGPYFNWQNPDNGVYVNGVLKFNRFRNESKVSMSDSTRAEGDYNNSGVSAFVEVGQDIKLSNNSFIKPFAQVSTAVIEGAKYDFDNEMEVDGENTRSLRGKLGVATGRQFSVGNDTVVQPYVHVALLHEFANNDDVQVNGNDLDTDLSGSGFEGGAGVAVSFSENIRLDAGFDYAKGKNFEAPFAVSVGLSYRF
ncbi:autotransporter outer membrane beta-barrel domain-containing protein [Pseudomonas sp. O230]|uniref:autotransporter outer membrane beta-barrel domain-containing protein n=1 Tax=Pseudomonas sp. O230 TaxID=3159450 RepID=UPI00387B3A56